MILYNPYYLQPIKREIRIFEIKFFHSLTENKIKKIFR